MDNLEPTLSESNYHQLVSSEQDSFLLPNPFEPSLRPRKNLFLSSVETELTPIEITNFNSDSAFNELNEVWGLDNLQIDEKEKLEDTESYEFLLNRNSGINIEVENLNSNLSSEIISDVISLTNTHLEQFRQQPNLKDNLQQTFGDNWEEQKAILLIDELINSKNLPSIEIVTNSDFPAIGAYSEENETIYLSQGFIEKNKDNLEVVVEVFLEEIGHYLDSQLNEEDSLGDEGEIFAALVLGKPLSETELLNLQTENDLIEVTIDGQIILVERSVPQVVGTISADNSTVTGSLTTEDTLNPARQGAFSDDYQLINITAAEIITISVESEIIDDDFQFDTYLQIINADTQKVIYEDDDGGIDTNSSLSFIPEANINYLVRVSSYDDQETGNYTLTTIKTETISANNQTVTGIFTTEDTLNPVRWKAFSDNYQLIDITEGELITISVTSGMIDTYLEIINADTQEVIYEDDDGGIDTNSSLSFITEADINYLVRVSSYSYLETANYTLTTTNGAVDLAFDLTSTSSNYVTPTQTNVGDTIEVSWTVTNKGSVTAIGEWYDEIYLSKDPFFNEDEDKYIYSEWIEDRTLNQGGKYTIDREITLRNDIEGGNWYLLIVNNNNRWDYLSESDKSNNTLALPLEIKAPDLFVSKIIDAPKVASLNQEIELSWIINNFGDAPTSTYWYYGFYLSDDQILDDNDSYVSNTFKYPRWRPPQIPLADQDSRSETKKIWIPKTAKIGNQYLLIVTDQDNKQGESNEDNNVYSVPIELKAPDLFVSKIIDAPKVASLSEEIKLSWNVKNIGEGIASTSWYDSIYLSDDQNLDENDTYITDDYDWLSSPLAKDDHLPKTRFFDIPETAKLGDQYLLIGNCSPQ
ncbi:MAG: CARDB domain-containing protein [Crocosphaera sp.]|nr:CARDB domain-containing protein [Crocosphaera sp.]